MCIWGLQLTQGNMVKCWCRKAEHNWLSYHMLGLPYARLIGGASKQHRHSVWPHRIYNLRKRNSLLLSCGCQVSCYKHEGLKNRNVLSHFWRLEVRSKGVSRTILPLKILRESHSYPFHLLKFLACVCVTSNPHMAFPSALCVSYQDTYWI
jgi:hypothetical protein